MLGTPFFMKSAAAQPYEAASLMKSAFGLMKSGLSPLIVEFCNLPIAKQKGSIPQRLSVVAADPGGHREEAEIAWYGR